jgi:hypothetical protein
VSADNLAKHVPAGTPGEAVCCPDGLGSIEAATKIQCAAWLSSPTRVPFRGFGGKRLPLIVIGALIRSLVGNVRQSGKRFALHCQQQADSAARSRLGQDQQAP